MWNTRRISRAALIAAVYALLTLVWPFSSGQVQVRLSEALTILPVFMPEAIPGLFVGCAISGLMAGSVWFDVVFGSLATLMAAYMTRRLRASAWLAPLPPVIFNAVIVGCVVHFAYVENATLATLPITMLSVGAGELVACYALGVPLRLQLEKLPESMWY